MGIRTVSLVGSHIFGTLEPYTAFGIFLNFTAETHNIFTWKPDSSLLHPRTHPVTAVPHLIPVQVEQTKQ